MRSLFRNALNQLTLSLCKFLSLLSVWGVQCNLSCPYASYPADDNNSIMRIQFQDIYLSPCIITISARVLRRLGCAAGLDGAAWKTRSQVIRVSHSNQLICLYTKSYLTSFFCCSSSSYVVFSFLMHTVSSECCCRLDW